jgi:hypothetical protein
MKAALWAGSLHGFVAARYIGSSLPDREGSVIRRCREAIFLELLNLITSSWVNTLAML